MGCIFENGKIDYEGIYINEEKDVNITFYYDNGQKKKGRKLRDGKNLMKGKINWS